MRGLGRSPRGLSHVSKSRVLDTWLEYPSLSEDRRAIEWLRLVDEDIAADFPLAAAGIAQKDLATSPQNVCPNASPSAPWFLCDRIVGRRRKLASLLLTDSLAFHAPQVVKRVASRILVCSETMLISTNKFPGHQPLVFLAFCHNRLCPVCSIQASMDRFRLARSAALPALRAGKLSKMTLTVPNCRYDQLRDAMRRLKASFHYMMGGSGGGGSHSLEPFTRCRGWFYSMEVTYNTANSTFHPHIHAMLDADYMPKEQCAIAWGKACIKHGFPRAKYTAIPFAVGRNDPDADKAFAECSKYYMKPLAKKLNLSHTPIISQIMLAVRSLRVVESHGSMAIPPIPRRKKSPWRVARSLRRWLKTQTLTPRTAEIKSRILRDNVLGRVALRSYSLQDIAPVKEKLRWKNRSEKRRTTALALPLPL